MLNYLDLCFDALFLSLSLRNMADIGQRGMSAQYEVERHRAHTHTWLTGCLFGLRHLLSGSC